MREAEVRVFTRSHYKGSYNRPSGVHGYADTKILDQFFSNGDRVEGWLCVETPGEYPTKCVYLRWSDIVQIEFVRPLEENETPASVG